MSDSKAGVIEITGYSSSANQEEALRDALSGALKALVTAGCGPQDIETVAGEVDEVGRFHSSRHEVELLYREVFAGFRKPVTLRRSGKPGLRVVITAKTPQPAVADRPVYRGYTRPEPGRQYSPRGQTDMNVLFKQWSKDGAVARWPSAPPSATSSSGNPSSWRHCGISRLR
jgi:arylformamidase